MGSGRDKRKKAKGGSAGQGKLRTAKKTERNEDKAERRAERRAEVLPPESLLNRWCREALMFDGRLPIREAQETTEQLISDAYRNYRLFSCNKTMGGEDDLDALLARFALEDAKQDQVEVVHNVACPSARVYASFIAVNPEKRDSDIIVFGGEFLDVESDKMYVKNELYRFHTADHSWSQIIAPNGPAPRTSHQAVVLKNWLYVFGGELTSVNQEKFRHYKDLWRLDLGSHKWEQLKVKKGPTARSGHRMLAYKQKLLLFGGFHDDDKMQTYYNDVWEFDADNLSWSCLETKGKQPASRGGCQLALHGDTLYVFGGHSIVRDKSGEQDKVHDDVWVLDLKTKEWERLRKAGIAPQPRTSFGLVSHKSRAFLFGGVSDQAGKGDRIYSQNFDEMYQFNLDSNVRRWFPVTMRAQVKAKAEGLGNSDGNKDSQAGPEVEGLVASGRLDKDSPLYRAAVRIQSRYRGYVVRKAYKTYKLGGKLSELLYSPATYGVDFGSTAFLRPRARQAPLMTVVKNSLWLMGGIVEVAHTDVVLDDIWTLDLAKLDGWKCVKENSCDEEAFKANSDWETDREDDGAKGVNSEDSGGEFGL